ncbi:MAG TPA: hypothetical protein VHG08_16180 [Longimicrobium sp.]|nr:hypothetical protein [Longimicrobium sp.]
MSLQSDQLAMIGLGVRNDQPPAGSLQPALPNGVHLRWGFARDLGFPWHGFHLFRRPARPGTPLCLSSVIGGLKKSVLPDSHHYTAIGCLSSDARLALTEDFAPGTQVELALDGRAFLRFDLPEGEPARRVDLRIGFRVPCLEVEKMLAAPAPVPGASVFRANPLIWQGVAFLVTGPTGAPAAQTQFDSLGTSVGPLVGLACGYGLSIRLPGPGNSVELRVTRTLSPATVEAYDAAGQKVASAQTQNPPNQPETIRLTGQSIVRVEILTLRNTAYLHHLCSTRKVVEGERPSVQVTAFQGSTAVRTLTVAGPPGQVVSASIAGDAITAVEIGPGPAALAELCYVPVAQDAAQGWEPLRDFSYPMGLPVSQPDYPCTAAAPAALMARVPYALPPEWGPTTFADLHQQLVELVRGGPAGAPMADRVFAAPPAVSVPPDPDPPTLSKLFILDMLLLGALHPALAQLLGLYWVDRTAAPGVAYDYLVVADHAGVGQRSAAKVLSLLQSSGFTQLDGWIVFNQRAAQAPPLPPPGAPQAYALPGSTFPDAQGVLPQPPNSAGLRWDVGWDAAGALLPDRAVTYLVWRDDLGDGSAPAPGGTPVLVTKVPSSGKPRPVMVTEPRLPRGSAPERPPDWPQVPLHYIDRGLPDGWYRWQVSGIDLFGRHSARGAPALLRLLDRTPPPMPTAVEAYALDPLDPHLRKDGAHQTWYAGVGPSVVGLRVRWRWTRAHQRQAPDTAEFRIYFHPGALPPADRDQPTAWQDRCFAVGFHSNLVQVDPAGDRVYEVFLPPPTDPYPASIPLNPSLAEPVVYAHVGVSAADGRPHTADARTGGDWGGRPGNEGRVGPPAKIYRVWRELPPAPAALMDDARYWASPADYHDRSFFTYRWKPEPLLKLHVFRALDDALFQADWARRPAGPLDALDADLFPPGWNAAGRQQVADALDHLDTLAAAPGADEDAVGAARRQAMAYYRQLSDGALRVLAGLPGNEGAFVQLTIQPLDPADPASANRRGPDNADGVVLDPNQRAYVDTLDGRATNRYFYRAALVDGAHNLGPLGPSTPPVYLPNVAPPRAPVITKVLGGDRRITLRWASNREPDLAEYRVYRTDREEAARDIRLMERVHTEPVSPGDPATRPAELAWDDAPVPGLTSLYYRLVAMDDAGNVSAPSPVFAGRAFDDSRPPPPTWEPPVAGTLPGEITLSWTSAIPDLRCLVQRRRAGAATWEVVSSWLPRGTYVYTDQGRSPSLQYEYRLRVMDPEGKLNQEYDHLTA